MNIIDLDDPEVFKNFDASGMRHRLRGLPDQCRKGWSIEPSPPLPPEYRKIERVLVLGIGGSAIGGDCLRDLMARVGGPTVEVYRDLSFSPSLDNRTLVIASSYSGNTQETLAAYRKASKSQARRLVFTSGGKLKALAGKDGIPLYTLDLVSEPRAALGFGLFAFLSCIDSLGLAPDISENVEEALALMENLVEELQETRPLLDNRAKILAWQLFENLIVVYGGDIFSSIARRWKTQINENSKAWAFYEILPEAGHNAVEGLERPGVISDHTRVVLLYSSALDAELKSGYAAIEKLLQKANVDYNKIEARGQGPLSQMMSLMILGDYTSYYLGILYGTDPSPVSWIRSYEEHHGRPSRKDSPVE